MRRRHRLAWPALVASAGLGALVVSSALAASIVGTAGNDVLRGTAKADRLLGKGGNDRLFGLGGDDTLQGGPGVDRYVCGPGRDTVIAATGESVARDCEVVKRVGTVTPPDASTPPPTTTTPPPAPSPPPPPTPLARPGFFGGFASTGGTVNFVVGADGLNLAEFKFTYEAECQPAGRLSGVGVTYSGTIRIAGDRTFSIEGTTAEGTTTLKFSGSFDFGGTSATGRFQAHRSIDYQGSHYECDSGGADWSAKWQG